jgi:cytochrome c oxidase assembly protein subunit 11
MAGTRRRNALTALALSGAVAGMVGLSFASVPLYRLFCQVTGYGGTTKVAAGAPDTASERSIVVRFNADVAGGLEWRFRPAQRKMRVRLGEVVLAYYIAENMSDTTLTGAATYNVTPHKVGGYFAKVDCFCFTEQTLAPGERVEMPVSFFVDADIASDPTVNEVTTITLSYTFFERPGGSAGGFERPGGSDGTSVSAALGQAERPDAVHNEGSR